MNARKRRRLYFAAAILVAAGVVTGTLLYELNQNIVYFHAPSEVAQVQPGVAFRIGGLVAEHSVAHGDGADVRFTVTDGKGSVPVDFKGVLPALFREGQGVIALGALNTSGTFEASEVLAKHDEKYMPPEVVQALKKSGRWKEGGGT